MKILHVTKKYPQALGGDAVVVSNLQKQQRAAGHHVVIVTSNCAEITGEGDLHKFGFKDSPARLDSITAKRLASLLTLFFGMFAILRQERPDVIHTHSIDMAFFISFAARFYGIPIVHTFHIVTFYDRNQSLIRRKTELWLAKKAGLQRATAPNMYDVKKLQTAGLAQTVLLPNGVDLAFWGAVKHARPSTFTFVSVGRLEQQKGYDYLIKAASLLTAVAPQPFEVIIVGEGSQQSALQELIDDLDLGAVISLVGRKNELQVRDFLSRADAAILPSLYETTPITLLEAWAAGLPVIATSVGVLREAPENFRAAYIVPPKDQQVLMLAMKQYLHNATIRTTASANGHREAKKYAWPAIAGQAEAIYQGVR